MTDANQHRVAEYGINRIFIERWSQRAYSGEAIEERALFGLFEAARWAPSASNSQPWRFIYARNGSEHWTPLFSLVNEKNQRWAAKAGVLIALLSRKTHVRTGDTGPTPLRNHSLDAGAAWLSLALQAAHAGLSARAIGGFDREQARILLGIPEGFHLEILIAVGKPADRASLDADLQAREYPTPRKPVEQFVAEGRFAFNEY